MVEVIIVGGGIVGSALAVALGRLGVSVALIESQEYCPSDTYQLDTRIYAISLGNKNFLAHLDVWSHILDEYIQPFYAMHIYGDRTSQLHIDSIEAGIPVLGYMVEHQQLQEALLKQIKSTPHITYFCPVQATKLETIDYPKVTLSTGEIIEAHWLIGADGTHSWVREQVGLTAHQKQYSHRAIVAHFKIQKPHRGIARQWFQNKSIMAWLPLPHDRISIVWSTQESENILQLSKDEFCHKVAAFGNLGAFELDSSIRCVPLSQLSVPKAIQSRIALVGDAAHTIHPLAGQGINLGLRDVRCLSEIFLRLPQNNLATYASERQADWQRMLYMTDGLYQLFQFTHPFFKSLRNIGLSLTDQSVALKRHFIRYACL